MTEMLAFAAEHVCRLTGLSPGQLRRWEQAGVFQAEYSDGPGPRAGRIIYMFRDLVTLRAMALLRHEHDVPLAARRQVAIQLGECPEPVWASLRFRIVDHHVVPEQSCVGANATPGTAHHQVVSLLDMQAVVREMLAAAESLRTRRPEDIGRITQRRNVVHNASVLAGTRIPTAAVWHFHTAGYSAAAIIEQYPILTPEDVSAAVAYEKKRREAMAG